MVCLIYLLLLAGDIELNPGPVPKEYTPSPKRTCKPKDRFMADVLRLRCTVCSLIIHELIFLFISPTILIFM